MPRRSGPLKRGSEEEGLEEVGRLLDNGLAVEELLHSESRHREHSGASVLDLRELQKTTRKDLGDIWEDWGVTYGQNKYEREERTRPASSSAETRLGHTSQEGRSRGRPVRT